MRGRVFLPAVSIILLSLPSVTSSSEEGAALRSFQDCDVCPEMVLLPPGDFVMGDIAGDGVENESPAHEVTIAQPLAISRYEVTFEEFDACVEAGGCEHRPKDENWGRGQRPVGDVSWLDAQEYVTWLSELTGRTYRLPTEAEWEYAARAGADTRYPWGDEFDEEKAVCLTCSFSQGVSATVGMGEPNNFGLYDMIGLQREIVEDCWKAGFNDAPSDGSAYVKDNCRYRVTRGGAWYDSAKFLRSSARTPILTNERDNLSGFRVVREE